MEENQKHCCCCDDAPEADAAADAAVPCCCRHKERSPEEYKALLNRLNRIEGQVRGIRGMLEKEAYCVDILVPACRQRRKAGRTASAAAQADEMTVRRAN